jgi:non-specific serine/threonine protein kinase
MTGKTISHYKILEKLGEGGMGVVYKAEDTKLKRAVALKFLPPHLTKNETGLARFLQEAQAAAALNHPNVCTIHEIHNEGESPFIVMEYVEGKTLKDIVGATGRSPLQMQDIILYTTQIAEALKAAHSKGIIHRDIKSENIMVTETGQVKVMDFGLAKLRGSVNLTKTSSTMGTVAYMSPEQVQGQEIDHRTDIWSLGVVLYEMLVGRLPFEGEYEAAVMYSVLNEKPSLQFKDYVPETIQNIVEKALEKKSDDRWQTVQEILGVLKQPVVELTKTEKREKSIIVLPFDDMSPGKDNEYFSDGLTEEIITDLSHIHELLVISRSSAMTFKGTKKKIREIAREVNVQYVLEGSVRKAGNNLRITAQLIDAATDAHLWAEKYSGTLDDVFDIQEKVSRSIVDALKLKLSAEEKKKITDRPIDNIVAYDCYLKANVEIWKFTEEDINSGIRHLQDGLDIMGDNALLYSGMAYAVLQLVNIGAKQDKDLAESKEIAKKALALDPESEKAHAVLGWIALWENPRQVMHHIKKALSICPDDAFALQGLAVYHIQVVGGIAEANRILKRLIQIDPLHFATNNLQGLVHIYDGEYNLAIPHFRRTLDIFPDNVIVQFYYAMALAYLGQMDQAFVLIDQINNSAPNNAFSKLGLMLKYAVQEKKDKVFHEMTADLQKTCFRDITFSHHLAGIFSLTGAKKEALDWLENAIDGGFINYPLLSEKDLFLENIRGEDRFKKLMKRMKKEWENFEV